MTEKVITCHHEVQFLDRECLLHACWESKRYSTVYFAFLVAAVNGLLLSTFYVLSWKSDWNMILYVLRTLV